MADGTCIFPLCTRKADKGPYCFLHGKHFSGPIPAEKPKPIARESKKRRKKNAQYRKKVGNEITAGETPCVVKSPDCTGYAQGKNHKQKRTEKNLMEDENLEDCCNACNGYIERHPAWAKENGHWVSRFVK